MKKNSVKIDVVACGLEEITDQVHDLNRELREMRFRVKQLKKAIPLFRRHQFSVIVDSMIKNIRIRMDLEQ